jgi:RNA polymerase sigma-32 factor
MRKFNKRSYFALLVKMAESYVPLAKDEEHELIKKYQSCCDKAALDKLIKHNLRYISREAWKRRFNKVDIMDLVEYGVIGFIDSVKKFDTKIGVRLSTYAKYRIKTRMRIYVKDAWSIVRLPVSNENSFVFYHKHLLDKEEKDPCFNETPASTYDIMKSRLLCGDVSMHSIVTGSEKQKYIDIIRDERESQEKEAAENEESIMIRRNIDKAMSHLTKRNAEIVRDYLMTGGKKNTFRALSVKYGVSRTRINQIVTNSIKTLRSKMLNYMPCDLKEDCLLHRKPYAHPMSRPVSKHKTCVC